LRELAEKYLEPIPQGLKPIEGQVLNVGAKAPTHKNAAFSSSY
jgi:hypothetical protein